MKCFSSSDHPKLQVHDNIQNSWWNINQGKVLWSQNRTYVCCPRKLLWSLSTQKYISSIGSSSNSWIIIATSYDIDNSNIQQIHSHQAHNIIQTVHSLQLHKRLSKYEMPSLVQNHPKLLVHDNIKSSQWLINQGKVFNLNTQNSTMSQQIVLIIEHKWKYVS